MNAVANMPAPASAQRPAHQAQGANHALWAWVLIGLAAYLVLPWYAIQDANGLTQIGAVFSDEPEPSGDGRRILIEGDGDVFFGIRQTRRKSGTNARILCGQAQQDGFFPGQGCERDGSEPGQDVVVVRPVPEFRARLLQLLQRLREKVVPEPEHVVFALALRRADLPVADLRRSFPRVFHN